MLEPQFIIATILVIFPLIAISVAYAKLSVWSFNRFDSDVPGAVICLAWMAAMLYVIDWAARFIANFS